MSSQVKIREQIYAALNVSAVTSTHNLYPELQTPEEEVFPRATWLVLDNLYSGDEKIYNNKHYSLAETVVQLKVYEAADTNTEDPEAEAATMLETMRRLISPANLTDATFKVGKTEVQSESSLRDANGVWIAIGRYRVLWNMQNT